MLNGVEVKYGNDVNKKGFIYEDNLPMKFPNLEKVNVGTEYIATLLYVKPLVNVLYFKVLPKKKIEWPFKFGDIVSGKVIYF